MPLPNRDNGFVVDLKGAAPQDQDKDVSQNALIGFIRAELISVPVRVTGGGDITTPQINDAGEITANGDIDAVALQSALERATGKFIDAVNHNLDKVFGK